MYSFTPVAIQHVNIVVPKGTFPLAEEFYSDVIGFANDPVPHLQKDTLRWFRVGEGPQQVHVAFEGYPGHPDPTPLSSRHPCFVLPSKEALYDLQRKIYGHFVAHSPASAQECDVPGEEDSGAKGIEYPTRFFVRDYAGNRLEFAVASSW